MHLRHLWNETVYLRLVKEAIMAVPSPGPTVASGHDFF